MVGAFAANLLSALAWPLFRRCPAGALHFRGVRYCHCRALVPSADQYVWDFRERAAVPTWTWTLEVLAGRR